MKRWGSMFAVLLSCGLASAKTTKPAGVRTAARAVTSSGVHAATNDTMRVNFSAHPPLYGLPPLHMPNVPDAEVERFRASLTQASRSIPGQRYFSPANEYAYSNARMLVRARKVQSIISNALRGVDDPAERDRIEAVYGSVYLQPSMMTLAMREVAKQTIGKLPPWLLDSITPASSDVGYLQKALTR